MADSFNPNATGIVYALALQADRKILVGGGFHGGNSIGGQTRNYIARLDPTTGGADSFDPNANSDVYCVAVQADNKVLAGGYFQGANSIGGQARNYIARLDATTGAADSFDPSADYVVFGIAIQADGKISATGDFVDIGGQPRRSSARLTNDTAALQNLVATQTAVTWNRGGSSPQVTHVTFEFSTDNISYSSLGEGMPSGSNWILTGLSLPIGQNFYIRARGYYHSGTSNDSEGITGSVRNAFISPPPTPTAVVSRKIHGGAGTFDINLPLTGNSGVECRSGGATNDYQIVFAFPGAVTFTGASLNLGTGSVSSSSGSGTTTVTVNLTGVTDAQRITLTLQGVSDGTNTGELNVPMGVLTGDTTGNGVLNSSDVSQIKLQAGQALSASNFRSDVNVNGSINASDVGTVKSKAGTALP